MDTLTNKDRIIENILNEFVLYLRHTFGSNIRYVGTTNGVNTDIHLIRDLDLMVVFETVSESEISYVWKIISRLHSKYYILLDTRIYTPDKLKGLPEVNQYLLKTFLRDLYGMNPFKDFEISKELLAKACISKIKEQDSRMLSLMPHVVDDSREIRAVAQCVADAIRGYLLLIGNPAVSKELAISSFEELFPLFTEVKEIYDGYLEPGRIIDISDYFLKSMTIVRHLCYKATHKEHSNSVLLINTPSSILSHPKNDTLSNDLNMPLGLVCLAAFLEKKRIKVNLLDGYAENLGVPSIIDKIFSLNKIPKIIGLNAASPNIHVAHLLARNIKRIDDSIVIVLGGPHASLDTLHALSEKTIDYAIVGEGEQPFSDLATLILKSKQISPDSIPGVYQLVSGSLTGIANNTNLDLSKLPLPNYRKLPLDRYFRERRRLYIHTTRGCSFNCIYCSVPKMWGRIVRQVSIPVLVHQLTRLKELYTPDEIQIVDDNFGYKNGQLIQEFCAALIEQNLMIKWKCQVRADQLNNATIKLMAKAGCFEVELGIESGNPEIQKYIRKNLNLAHTVDVVREINSNSIKSKAFFMLGFPNESFNQLQDTINYSIKLKLSGLVDVAFFPVMPFPGTDISESSKKVVYQGAIIDETDNYDRSYSSQKLRKYSAKPEVSLNSNFNPDDLRLLVKFAYERFFHCADVIDLEKEFGEYKIGEENAEYGI